MNSKDTPTIYNIGISGGKDSDALAIWAVYESGLPKSAIRGTFCDTGNESELTYEHVRMLSKVVFEANGLAPIEWLKPERDFYELADYEGRFASSRARFCTDRLKIKPTMARVKLWQEEGYEVILLSGVRAGESKERSLLSEREYNSIYDCEMWRPLLTWSISDVWAIHEKYNVPRNPLYDMGAERVGCLPCVMSRKAEIANIAKHFPERIDRIREEEHKGKAHRDGLRSFFSPTKVPLRYRTIEFEKEIEIKEATVKIGGLFDEETITTPASKKRKVIALAMIDDVVQWALSNDVEQGEFDLSKDIPAACSDKWGMCE